MQKGKKFLGIMFECCNIYRRIYINKDGNAYEGRCPKCFGEVKIIIGQDGSEKSIFRARGPLDLFCQEYFPRKMSVL